MPLLIYTENPTNRINYILNFLFVRLLHCEIEIVHDGKQFDAYTGAKFSYAEEPLGDELFFKQSGFLLQEGLSGEPLETVGYRDYTACFPVTGSAMPFDVFSAAFFLISRYEEYNLSKTDQHGRFRAEDSFAFRAGFLRQPVIDQWAYEILTIIQTRYADFAPPERKYSYIPTIDIDRAYAWKYSNLSATGARLLKNLALLRWSKAKSIVAVKLNKEKDPFDTYQLMQRIHKGNRPIFFFLMGDCSRYDNSISCELPQFRYLIQDLAQHADTGIHPSYQSNSVPEKLAIEKSRLEEILKQPVRKSRQHFLRMEMPLTYQRLIQHGIDEDHSMGFASQAGFRAGTCTPFNWYDLSQEKETNLVIYPFAAMEVTLSKYMCLSPDAAFDQLQQLCDVVKAVNGTFITLWHNESLADTGHWKGWRKVYEQIVKYASN